jgi:lipopolysaccharide export system protein LptC
MSDAIVDFHAGTLSSDRPISIGYGDSEVAGDKLSIGANGKHIVIEGTVRTVLMPPKRKDEAPPGSTVAE